MGNVDPLDELRAVCAGAANRSEGGHTYIELPQLVFPSGAASLTRDALLSPTEHSGYSTRLFLSEPVPGKGNNWTPHVILGRTWHTWSWNGVPSSMRPAQILADHLRGLR